MVKLKCIYFVGLEVFFFVEEYQVIVVEKKCLFWENGFEGVDLLDMVLIFLGNEVKFRCGYWIYWVNCELMDSCDVIIVNLIFFCGISVDLGIVFEVGYMVGQGKFVFGFILDN